MATKDFVVHKKRKLEFFRHLCHKNKVEPTNNETQEIRRQILASSYVEHHLNLQELSEVYSNSYIDVDNPDESDGLDEIEAL